MPPKTSPNNFISELKSLPIDMRIILTSFGIITLTISIGILAHNFSRRQPTQQNIVVKASSAPIITTTNLPEGYPNQYYQADIHAIDPQSQTPPHITITQLPPGITPINCFSINPSSSPSNSSICTIEGSTANQGIHHILVTVIGFSGQQSQQWLEINILRDDTTPSPPSWIKI